MAERQDGSCITSQALSHPKGSTEGPSLAEDIGREAAFNLMMEIERVGGLEWIGIFLVVCFVGFYFFGLLSCSGFLDFLGELRE